MRRSAWTVGVCHVGESSAGLGVVQAATRLGISVDAVRKRIRRKTLRAYKVGGQWRIILDEPAATDQPHDRVGDQDDRPGHDQGIASSLIAQVQSEVAFLRQLTEHQAGVIAQQAQTIADLARRVPELPAGSPTPAPETPHSAPQTAATPPPRRPWWRRLLGT